MWNGFSAAATDALAGNCVVAVKVEVWTDAGTFETDITYALDVTNPGQVVEDETAPVRRTCTLNLVDPDLIPGSDSDLLHPLTGNELRVYRGVWLPGAPQPEYAPLGVFRLSKPSITDSGTAVTMTLNGNDRSSEISRRSWTGPYPLTAGMTVQAAIQQVINSRWTGPKLSFNMYPSTVTIPAGTVLGVQFTSSGVQAETGSQGGNNDPFADCRQLAVSAGCELLFDRVGQVVMRPVPEPGQLPTVASFVEGAGCTVVSASRKIDETKFFNGVILIGTGATVTNSDGSTSPAAPVVASAYSTDPQLGPGGPLGERPDFIVDQIVSTLAEAQVAANAQLPLVLNALDGTSFSAVESPALDAGDQDYFERARMKAAGNYIVSAVTHPLSPSALMQVTNRAFAVTA